MTGGLAELLRSLGGWTYAAAGAMAFVEVGTPLGLVAPTELAVPLAGAAAAAGSVALVPLVLVVWICAAAGDSCGYLAGRRFGRTLLERHGRRVRVTEERLLRLERQLARRGTIVVLVARFGTLVRTLTPFVAGAGGMPYRQFVIASVAGAGLWAVTFCTLGYALAGSAGTVADVTTGLGGAVAAAAVLLLAAAAVRAALRQRRRRRTAGRRPAPAATATATAAAQPLPTSRVRTDH